MHPPYLKGQREKKIPEQAQYGLGGYWVYKKRMLVLFHHSTYIIYFPGSMDNTVKLWDTLKAFDDVELDDFTAATGHIHLPENSQELLLGTYMTKSTPVIHLHFTRRNLLLAAGAYNP